MLTGRRILNIQANNEKGVFSFRPSNEEEDAFLKAVTAARQPGGKIKYNGRSSATVGSPCYERMVLNFLLDGRELKFNASDDQSEEVIRRIREVAFFVTGALVFIDQTEVDDKFVVNFCVACCQLCNNSIIERGCADWKTCESCIEKCKHDWTLGLKKDLSGSGEYCSKCGASK